MPLATEVSTLSDGGIDFVVRIAELWRRKPEAGREPGDGGAAPSAPGDDPFLPPYEPDLFVGELTATHVALLNKFPALADHLLLVTRHYESQTAALTVADFEALLTGLAGVDGLAFYNGGRTAGASQPHRHLQLVPLPLGPGEVQPPVRRWFDAMAMPGPGPTCHPDLPFEHRVMPMPPAWLAEPTRAAVEAEAVYRRMWAELGRHAEGWEQPEPFNLLATREWLWLVPRRCEGVAGLSVNALGFAGCLLAGDRERFATLERIGPMALLARVGFAR